ncbi:hypothetical protein FGIG_08724 [Fasciola gigantica]|uniref:Uncharacterized protein n=1 Tax=Fasciola gigantica TaxID=46835 RepID=A0A504YYE1_FASGI|nr:hypothetical protein FGIG_08724 [Fasciola gigantica]
MSENEIDGVEPTVEEQDEIEKFLNVDDFLEEVVGSHGLWQWLIALYLMISTPSAATLPVYVNNYSPFRCRMEASIEDYITQNGLSFTDVAERIGPWSSLKDAQNSSAKIAYGCSRYQLNWLSVNLSEVFNITSPTSLPSTATEKCPLGYVYSQSEDFYPGNVVKQFDVVCDHAHFQSLGTSAYMFGIIIGFLFGGWSGDRFGRRITLTVASAIEVVATIIVSTAPNYAVYVVFRSIVAIGNSVKVSVGFDFAFRAYMALCAYLIPDWRALNAALMCTGALGLLYPLILPESPRWLISRKHLRKAIDQMHRGCQINQRRRTVIEEEYFDQLRDKAYQMEERIRPMRTKCRCSCKGCKNALWLRLFKSAKLIRVTALSSFFMFGIIMCFFGLILYAGILFGSIYLNGFLSSLTAIPADIGAGLIYRYIRSRKKPLVAVLSFAAVFLIPQLF